LIRKLKSGLLGISHVIVDEIHERCADSDFLLIILKDMIQTYPDLRVILMSANVNIKLFSGYFNNCPIIDVGECCYLVEGLYIFLINFEKVQILNYVTIIIFHYIGMSLCCVILFLIIIENHCIKEIFLNQF